MATTIPVQQNGRDASRVNISQNERMASAAGGAWLLLSGLRNVRNHPAASLLKVAAGGYLIVRGSTGHCAVSEAMGRDTSKKGLQPITIKEALTVNRPKGEVYDFWRKLENLPRFMKHLKTVTQTSPTRSHWEAQLTKNLGTLQWDAEIVQEKGGELLSWKSVPGATVENSGEVVFKEAPGNRGTEVHATISYTPPAGEAGKLAAKLLNEPFSLMIREDLRRFKRMMEAGEEPELDGQPAARATKGMPFNF